MSDFTFKEMHEATELLLSDEGAEALAIHYAYDNDLGTDECWAMEKALKNQQLGIAVLAIGFMALSLLEMARFGLFIGKKFKKR